MREKKWVDCPACGSKGTMRFETDRTECWTPKGYPPVQIGGIEGYFCSRCGEGFWTRASERKIAAASAEHRARYDSTVTVASDLMSVSEAAKILKVSPQAVHQMMNSGRIRYVIAGDTKLPIRFPARPRKKASNSKMNNV